jgi:DNA topoisomerase IB
VAVEGVRGDEYVEGEGTHWREGPLSPCVWWPNDWGNTPAICRRFYVHPARLDGYVADVLAYIPHVDSQDAGDNIGQEPDERALLDLLRASEALAKTDTRAS